MRDIRPIQDRIAAGEFENVLPFPTDAVLDKDPAYVALDKEQCQLLDRTLEIKEAKKVLVQTMHKEYGIESTHRRNNFKTALEEEYGLQNHPKRDEIWRQAWEDGHSGGWGEVLCEYDELYELLS